MKHKKKIITIALFSIAILPLFVILSPPKYLTAIGITKVEWYNNRGGSGPCNHLYDKGTTWKWDCKDIKLQSGQNIITVTATNIYGKKGIDTLVVNKQ